MALAYYPFISVEDYLLLDNTSQDAREEADTISHPSFVAEVLSPSTEAVDRGKKSIYYRQFQSIQEYRIITSEPEDPCPSRHGDESFLGLGHRGPSSP